MLGSRLGYFDGTVLGTTVGKELSSALGALEGFMLVDGSKLGSWLIEGSVLGCKLRLG